MHVVGRDAELAAGADFLASSADSASVMLIEGEAGIGKTTVWAALVDRARRDGRLVLVARPARPESALTLSTLADLLDPVDPAVIGRLPPPQRAAVEAALLRSGPAEGKADGRLLGVALRTLVAELAAERPVILAIDDVQWADPTSAAVVAFAVRRLEGSRVGLLAAMRSGEPSALDVAALLPPSSTSVVRVGGLTVAALHHAIVGQLGRPLTRSVLVRVHAASGGSPLFALEIARVLFETGIPGAGEPLPVPGDVRSMVRRRVMRLPARSREVLLAAAVDGHPPVAAVERAMGRPVERDLAVASRLEVAHVEGDRIVFDHPLFAGAVVSVATPAERRDAHRRMADVAETDEMRARHRALAATVPTEEVAAELEAAARTASGRGLPAVAADLLDLALAATPPASDAQRERRMLELVRALQRAGEQERARSLAASLVESSTDPVRRARARIALATILYELDVPAPQLELCETAIVEAEGVPEVQAHAHAVASAASWDDFDRAARHASAAVRLIGQVPDPDPAIAGLVLLVRCESDVSSGRGLDRSLVERALALEERAAAPSIADRFSAALGTWLKYEDDLDGARQWIERTIRAATEEGDEGSLPYAVSHVPELELWAGDWEAAEAAARRHLDLALATGLESQRRQAGYNLALVLAHRGEETEARAFIDDVLAAARSDGDTWVEAAILGCLGFLLLSHDDPRGASDALVRSAALRDEAAATAPRRSDADLVESLVRAGEVEAARVALAAVEARAARFGRHSARANAARARGIVAAASGDLDGALAALDTALAEHDLAPIPFDRARTLLVLGQVRRRRRERAAAKEALDASLAIFERLGARLWAGHASASIERLGLRRSSSDELTEGERRTAELAATGMTNREIAAAMFVSPKTVEANLARAYAKLGVRTRAELGALMVRGGAPDRPKPPPGRGEARTAGPGLPPRREERR